MAHYFSEKQESSLNIKKIIISTPTPVELFTASGIFSKDRLDQGTYLLIKKAIVREGFDILDLGCGYGAVGISLKLKFPGCNIVMSDINERAVMIADKNIRLHRLDRIKAVKSDVFSAIPEKFDTILLNPPQTAGKELCFRMIRESKEHLNEGGLLQIVARHNKGGSTLREKMKEIFGNAIDLASSSGYRIYVSENQNASP